MQSCSTTDLDLQPFQDGRYTLESTDRTASTGRLISRSSRRKHRKDRRGAMLILVVVMIVAFIVTVAFSVDIAYMNLVNTELRSATDAAAKAASEALARTQSTSQAIARAKEIASENRVANIPLQLADSDVQFGRSEFNRTGKFVFQPGLRPFNSVRVVGSRQANSISGSVGLFFGRALGVNNFQPTSSATATYIQRDIVLVVDRSGSMLDDNKFNDLRAALQLFVSILTESPVEERIGLASYSNSGTEDLQLTTELDRVNTTMANMPVAGFTNIGDGIDKGANIMQRGSSREFVEKTMIVLTDGLQNAGRSAASAARDQVSTGTILHAITFGRDADQRAMREVARIGKGSFFHASNGAQLKEVFEEIALTLNTIITE